MSRLLAGLLALIVVVNNAQSQDVPTFEPLFSPTGVRTSVNERAPEGTLILTVRAQGSTIESIMYGISLPPGDEGVFRVDPATGNITVGPNGTNKLVIQNGNPTTFVFEVFAYYSSVGLSGDRTYLMVTVDVRDINDPPVFVEQDTDIAVTEGAAVASVIHRFMAVDGDLSLNGAVVYSLEELEPVGNEVHFIIHSFTGDLQIALSLDISEIYRLRVTARDEGIPPLNTSLLVTVRVDPVPPVFEEFVYSTNVTEFTGEDPENVITVRAVDSDPSDSPQGIIEYAVVSWIPENDAVVFDVGLTSGVVTVAGTLDRETFSRYVVIVKAYEQGQHPDASSETAVVVQVLDVNEPPVFLSSHYSAALPEGAGQGAELAAGLAAVDPDEGTNAELTFSINETEGLTTLDGSRVAITEPFFLIDPSTGVISLNTSLEREAAINGFHYYEIIVVVTDGGSPSLSASTVVALTVTDVNDNPPVLANATYVFSIHENLPPGTQVGEVVAADRDEGPAANLTFVLMGPLAERFAMEVVRVVHPTSPEARPPTVTTARVVTLFSLDREETTSYSFTMVVMDTTTFPLNATAAVVINVEDVNDNTPQFSSANFSLQVPEETVNETFVAEFAVTDRDVGPNAEVNFTLEAGEAQEFFTLVSSGLSTELHLAQPLDRESQDFYSFRIFATDGGSPALVGETRISITVTDVNDNPPMFDQDTFYITIPENFIIEGPIVTLNATDADLGINAQVIYAAFQLEGIVEVDNMTGDVYFLIPFDFEMVQTSTIVFEITAFDPGFLHQIAMLIVTLTDENDNAPVFMDTPYNASVNENAPVGSEAFRVVASDADSNSFGEVTYGIVDGDMGGSFLIDNTTGSITVGRSLDRETVEQYNITVMATDGGDPPLISETNVEIEVLDVNDNAPEFLGAPYVAEVSEGINGSVGALVFTVAAVDNDEGSNAEISYSLSGSGAEHFTIDAVSGEVRVSSLGVDFERVLDSPYVLTVIATDDGIPPRIIATTLNITVLDANDNQPIFIGAPYSATWPEGTVGPLVVLNVTAIDQDVSSNGQIEYSISDGDGIFTINSQTGMISLVDGVTLDREAPDLPRDENGNGVYTFGVTAHDQGNPVQLNHATVYILVSDVNDHSPVFTADNFFIQLSEGFPTGAVIITFLATDNDVGSNAQLVYSIESQTPDNGQFTIDPDTGALLLDRTLDRESQSSFMLVIVAIDQGPGNNQGRASVQINVTDVNDNQPVFSDPQQEVHVSETDSQGTVVATVSATDRDLGTHMEITYAINNTGVPFEIADPSVGVIIVSGSLDRETTAEYLLIVVATDSASTPDAVLQGFATVRVIIDDVNDNQPFFGSPMYMGTVQENVPIGTTVQVTPPISVSDADVGINAEVSYSLSGPDSEVFSIDPATGVINTSAPLDLENIPIYPGLVLTVQDRDGFNSTASLTIIIGDTNDHSPIFLPDSIGRSIAEDTGSGSEIIVVSAEDADEGTNGLVTYSLLNGGSLFEIDPLTGAITLTGTLDYETMESHLLTVRAMDAGDPIREGFLNISLTVTDENDNSPVFLNPDPTFTVTEHSPDGTHVGVVTAIDEDSGNNAKIEYAIILGDGDDRFVINPENGSISTTGDIDREEWDIYWFLVEARDSGTSPLIETTNVTVLVMDVNDNAPVFPQPSTPATISETMNIGTGVIVLTAVDADFGTNAELTYSIQSSTPAAHFSIDGSTGLITTTEPLDYENVTSYMLVIDATDSGSPTLTGTTNLTINVQDENDNSPAFTQTSYEANIPENSLEGALVETVIAGDADSGSNAQVTYEIVNGNTGSAFQIDSTSGMVTVENQTALDRETTASFLLQIQAQDQGSPPLASQTLLLVTLSDENDNAPQFTSASPSASIAESQETERIVLMVDAMDRDEGSNAAIIYSITAGNEEGKFEILQVGTVRTAEALDYETTQSYDLTIQAVDGGTPTLTGTTRVTIAITDINDNRPEFDKTNEGLILVAENATVGELLSRIDVFDADSGENRRLSFRIVTIGDDTVPFNITNDTGELRLTAPLDRETQEIHYVLVEIVDGGSPPLSEQMQFTVVVTDVDDNPPRFEGPVALTLSEDHPLVVPFVILPTTDQDVNVVAYYYIIGGDSADLFEVSRTSGSVSLRSGLNRENQAVNTVEFAVRNIEEDPGNACTDSATCSVTTLTVTVEDVNDNPPVWTRELFRFGVDENARVDRSVGRIQATDADSGNFSTVHYQLVSENTTQFALEMETGIIRLEEAINIDSGDKITVFIVTAFDNPGGNPSLSVCATVIVYVIRDENTVTLTVLQPLDEVLASSDALQSTLASIEGAHIIIYDIQPFLTSSQKRQIIDDTRTNVLVFGIDPETNETIPSDQLLETVDANLDVIGQVISIESVMVSSMPSEEPTESDSTSVRLILYIIIGILGGLVLAVCLTFTITYCILARRKQSRRGIFNPGDRQFQPTSVGTISTINEYSTISPTSVVPNPIYSNPYGKWSEEEEQEPPVTTFREHSPDEPTYEDLRDSALYDSKEFVMEFFEDSEEEEEEEYYDDDEIDPATVTEAGPSLEFQFPPEDESDHEHDHDRMPLIRGQKPDTTVGHTEERENGTGDDDEDTEGFGEPGDEKGDIDVTLDHSPDDQFLIEAAEENADALMF